MTGTGAFPGRRAAALRVDDNELEQTAQFAATMNTGQVARQRRLYGDERRSERVVVRFGPRELTQIEESASRNGLAVGAWIGQLALRAALGDTAAWAEGPPEVLRRLMGLRMLVLSETVSCSDGAVQRIVSQMDELSDIVACWRHS